jgi:hypothetical protein
MIKIQNEKKVDPILVKSAREYCETIGSDEIYNIAYLGERDYRIMYYDKELDSKGNRKMKAVLLKVPETFVE